MDKIKKRWAGYFVGLLVVLAAAAWWLLRPPGLPEGLPAATAESKPPKSILPVKSPGVSTPFWSKRVSLCQGEVLARMDTRVLNEQRLEAAAQIKEAESAVPPPEPCSISDKVKCAPAKRW
jgi:HlyD family secretion protein